MKKNETANAEEKKLIWKFKDLPTASEIGKLVDTKVITPAEGREILFREAKEDTDEVKALKDMVETLQGLVKEMLSRPNVQYVPYTKVIEVPRRQIPYWDTMWTTANTGLNINSTSGTSGNTTYTLSVG